MRVRILLQLTDDDGSAGAAEEVATFAKATERPEDAVQHQTVVAQVAEWSKRHRCCETCGEQRPGAAQGGAAGRFVSDRPPRTARPPSPRPWSRVPPVMSATMF